MRGSLVTGCFRGLAACAAAMLVATTAAAQTYPSKPIRIIVPAPPGNTSDAAVRYLGQKMSTVLNQPVVVDNRAGANGSIGVSIGLRSPADGYTLTMIASTNTVAAMHMMKNLPYNPLTEMAPVAGYFEVPTVFVANRNFPPSTFKEVIDYVRAQPGKVSFAYANATGAVAGASVRLATGTDMIAVPYKSGPQAVQEVIGGQVPLFFIDVALALPHIQSGSLKAYAVTSASRSSVLKDTPTLRELLPDPMEFVGWAGFVAPPGTPQPIVARLNQVINDILKQDDTVKFLRNVGAEPVVMAPEQYADYIRSQEPKWARALKAAGIQPE